MRFVLKNRGLRANKSRLLAASKVTVEAIESRVLLSGTTLTAWNFDTSDVTHAAIPAATNFSPDPSTGSGTSSSIGMALVSGPDTSNITPVAGSSDSGTSDVWRIVGTNGWSSTAPIGSQGAQFLASTAGYTAVSAQFDWYTTTQGEGKLQVQYTTDGGTTWTTASALSVGADTGITVATNNSSTQSANTVNGSYFYVTGGQNWYNGLTVDLSGVAATANSTGFGIRLVNAATGADNVNSSGVALNNTSGNWRFDEVQILGVVPAAPAITLQPTNQSVTSGTNATFTAAASGGPTPTVQWQISTNGGTTFTDIAGATSTSYTVTAGAGNNNNQFRAVFTNSQGAATTNAATLTLAVAPVITTQPANQAVNAGSTATFTAAASSTSTLTVQWQVSTNGGTTFTDIPGATSTTLNVPTTVDASQAGNQYRAVFTNAQGSTPTNAAILTVIGNPISQWTFDPPAGPGTVNPSYNNPPTTVGTGTASTLGMDNVYTGFQSFPDADVTLSPSALNPGFSEYTWRIRGGPNNNVAGGTPDGWSNSAPQYTQGAEFDVPTTGYKAITVAFDWYTTSSGIRDLQEQYTTNGTTWTNIGPKVIAAPNDFYGITPTTTPTPVLINLQQIPGANNNPNFGIRLVSAYDSALPNQYASATLVGTPPVPVQYTEGSGNWRFDNITFNGTTQGGSPGITSQPKTQTIITGNAVTFTATAIGTPSPTVQWQVSTDGGTTFTDIAGATSTTYSFTTGLSDSGHQFRAVFTNTGGTATTNAATLTVVSPVAPTITTQPSNQSVVAGNTAVFSAAAAGTPTPTAQWQVSTDGGTTFTNIAGATQPTYSFPASASQTGYLYRAVFSNGVNPAATTNAVSLTVLQPGNVITDWAFSATVAAPDNSPAPSIGAGTATSLGFDNNYFAPATSTTADDITLTASAKNATFNEYLWRIRGGAPGTANGWSNSAPQYTQGAEFDVNTVGYKNIYVTLDWYSTNQGIRDLQEQYTIDGTTWVNTGPLLVAIPNDYYGATSSAPTGVLVDLSAIPAVNNNAKVGIRLVSAYDPTLVDTANGQHDWYAGATLANGAPQRYNGTSGNWRFGSIAFNGTPLATAPTLVNSLVGDGSAQRSTFDSSSVVFNEKVNFTASSFTLSYETVADNQAVQNSGGSLTPTFTTLSNANDLVFSSPDGGITWTVSPKVGGAVDRTAGAGDSNGLGVFIDGLYSLNLHGAAITDLATSALHFSNSLDQVVQFADGTGTLHHQFSALFGDIAGTANVTANDNKAFSKAFLTSSGDVGYNAAFDYTGTNSSINANDNKKFSKNFLVTLLLS